VDHRALAVPMGEALHAWLVPDVPLHFVAWVEIDTVSLEKGPLLGSVSDLGW
jgi:hypothetical protein